MNPTYTVFIDISLLKLIDGEEIYMRMVTRLPFVPRQGDNLLLTEDDNEDSTLELCCEKVVYDTKGGAFVVSIEDNRMVDQYKEEGTLGEQEAVGLYRAFGFQRLNFPQGEGRP